MKAGTRPTLLGYAILGLLSQEERTGYSVRKVFEETPMGHYSSSPGSIYPALRRLASAGLIEQASSAEAPSARSRPYRLTASGLRALRAWISRPISREDVRRESGLMLRFAFAGDLLDRRGQRKFLRNFRRGVDAYLEELLTFRDAHKSDMSGSGLAAFEHGIELYRAHSRWAGRTLNKLEKDL